MNTQTYLLPQEGLATKWQKTPEFFYRREDRQFDIILISDIKADVVEKDVRIDHVFRGFNDALHIIPKLLKNELNNRYKVIVINIPLSVADLEKFSTFFRRETRSIIVYNKEKLTCNEAKFIKAFGLVEDVTNLADNELNSSVKNVIRRRLKLKQETWYNYRKQAVLRAKEKAINFSFLLKTIFDISVAALLILALLPIFIFIGIAIKLESKGPIFYSSPRAGKGYKIFKFYKFRSMVNNADEKIDDLAHLNQYAVAENGPLFFKVNNDPRITRVGKFLRNTSLDELPQLFNILLGHMSLVGNRPLPLYEAATLTTNEYVERFSAPAGITGFWQIKKRGKAEMSVKERVALDITYARKASPLFDLYILANTPAALFQKSDV